MDRRPYLAIITARGGSKRLPGKNLIPLNGIPLIGWSIRAAQASREVAAVYVSTDSKDIQTVSLSYGAQCPDLRSADLATDIATSAAVVHDVLDKLKDELDKYAGLVLLQPTSPLRSAEDIDAAVAIHRDRNASAVVSVCETECPPAWMGQIPSDGSMDAFIQPDLKGKRSQDLGDWYRINGAIYIIGFERFREENGFLPKGALAYLMPRERSIDIDRSIDLRIAEALIASVSSK